MVTWMYPIGCRQNRSLGGQSGRRIRSGMAGNAMRISLPVPAGFFRAHFVPIITSTRPHFSLCPSFTTLVTRRFGIPFSLLQVPYLFVFKVSCVFYRTILNFSLSKVRYQETASRISSQWTKNQQPPVWTHQVKHFSNNTLYIQQWFF